MSFCTFVWLVIYFPLYVFPPSFFFVNYFAPTFHHLLFKILSSRSNVPLCPSEYLLPPEVAVEAADEDVEDGNQQNTDAGDEVLHRTLANQPHAQQQAKPSRCCLDRSFDT